MVRSNRPILAFSAVVGLVACGRMLATVPPIAAAQPVPSATEAQPATPSGSESATASDGIALSHIPGDAVVVVVYRPADLVAALAADEDLAAILAEIPNDYSRRALYYRAQQITTTWPVARFGDPAPNIAYAMAMRFADPIDLEAEMYSREMGEEISFANTIYHVSGTWRGCRWQIDDRTLLMGSESMVQSAILTGARVRSDLFEGEEWEAIAESAHIIVSVDVVVAHRAGAMPDIPDTPLGRIWEETERLILAFTFSGLSVTTTALLDCTSKEGTVTVKDAIDTMVSLIRGQSPRNPPGEFGSYPDAGYDVGIPWMMFQQQAFFDSLEVTVEGTSVTVSTTCEIDPMLLELHIRRGTTSSTQMAFEQQQKCLRQIGLALHNYYHDHGHFPPATIIDEDSGSARSWRVEILPYLDQAEFYAGYRKDEPWDSEHNMAILAQMPAVYAPPIATGDVEQLANHTGILAIVGEGTGFAADGEGLRFRDFTDGTSRTLLVVDSPGELVPWTKPDDLEVVIQGDEVDLGGLHGVPFHALFCDGSVYRFWRDRPAEDLILRMGRDDGRPTPYVDGN